jgi:hypothetical protein
MRTEILRTLSRRRLHLACLAAASATALVLASCGGASSSSEDIPTVIEANISTLAAQIGGGTQAVALYTVDNTDGSTTDWTLYSMANRFAVTPVGTEQPVTVPEIWVPGYIQHITVVKGYAGKDYALLSMGGKGIGVVDITNPAVPTYVSTMTVAYTAPAYHAVDGGGTEFDELETPYESGPVSDLLVHDDQTDPTPDDPADDALFIANGAYGIQKTRLSNLLDTPADGALAVDDDNDPATPVAQAYTLKYASENPWGGPQSLKMHGGRLYAALGFRGIAIYNPATLERSGWYNLYADCANRTGIPAGQQEDWFGYPQRKIACPATGLVAAAGVDAVDEGMPTWQQAMAELADKNDLDWYPWAEFDRYGKYYYNARTMELVDLPDGAGTKTVAYIAYSLGGLVAVDVTNASETVQPTYVGYVPAAPAHGPNEPPINVDKKGILSHFGSGMLKEAGVMDVRVVPDAVDSPNYKAYYTDHFAGLVVVGGAEDPATRWKNPGAPFDNNKIEGVTEPRAFWPDYEFVTSYNMTPVPVGDESLPAFLVPGVAGSSNADQYAAPVLLSTGEINGHGGALFLMPTMNTAAAGQVDAVQSSGAGGVSYVDFIELSNSSTASIASRFGVPVNLVSTNEVGAAVDGSATQAIAIGHAEGVTVSGNRLYLGDGPHGVSVWRIADGLKPIDDLHLVANTLADEYPDSAFPNVIPTPHAFKIGFGDDLTKAYVMSQSLGMRRVDVSAVTGGTAAVGAPALLTAFGGVFEHGGTDTKTGPVEVIGQDHAYGVTFSGKYAIVADGDNGLTVYDTTVDPTTGAHVVGNIGDADGSGSKGKPPLGRASAVKLWKDGATGKTYAVVAAGAYGISVVDMTAFLASGSQADLGIDKLLKTFEPIKVDEDNAFGSADGKSVDVHVVGDIAYLSYDSYGIVAYRMADLIRPLSAEELAQGCTPTQMLIKKTEPKISCRPEAAGRFKLQIYGEVIDETGVVVTPSIYADLDGGAQYMTPQLFPTVYRDASGQVVTLPQPKLLFYVAYAEAGVVKLDWSDVANPIVVDVKEVVGGASATAINNGRVYVAAGAGGLTVLK